MILMRVLELFGITFESALSFLLRFLLYLLGLGCVYGLNTWFNYFIDLCC